MADPVVVQVTVRTTKNGFAMQVASLVEGAAGTSAPGVRGGPPPVGKHVDEYSFESRAALRDKLNDLYKD